MSKALGICHGDFGRALLLALDRPLVAHAHAQSHLLVKLGGADTRFRIGPTELLLGAEHAILVRPWETHDYPHGRQPEPATVLALYLEPAWLAAAGLVLQGPLVGLDDEAQALVRSIGSTLLDGGGACGELTRQQVAALLHRLQSCSAGAQARAANPVDRRLRKALTLIHERLGETIDFAALAGEAGLSRAHFFELFRRDLGLTPAVYLNTHRMARAIEAVEQRGEPIVNVALDLGFSAQSNFTRFFRDIQGVPPNDYRQATHAAGPDPADPTLR